MPSNWDEENVNQCGGMPGQHKKVHTCAQQTNSSKKKKKKNFFFSFQITNYKRRATPVQSKTKILKKKKKKVFCLFAHAQVSNRSTFAHTYE